MYDSTYIQNDFSSIAINPQGGYVTSWKARSKSNEFEDILYMGSTIRRTGIPILFPYYGKARQTRMHGFGRDSLWRVTPNQEKLLMELNSDDLDAVARTEYPYLFSASISISPDPTTSAFIYSLSIKNEDSKNIPISPGLHPYWKIPHEEKKSIKIEGLTDFNANTVDWDNAPPDTPYEYLGPVTATLHNKKITVEEIDEQKHVSHIQIWSQTPVSDPDYNFICIEPICGLNYGIDDTPILVKPQETWEMNIRFSVTDA